MTKRRPYFSAFDDGWDEWAFGLTRMAITQRLRRVVELHRDGNRTGAIATLGVIVADYGPESVGRVICDIIDGPSPADFSGYPSPKE